MAPGPSNLTKPRVVRLRASNSLRVFSSGSNSGASSKIAYATGVKSYRKRVQDSIRVRRADRDAREREEINDIRDIPDYGGEDEDSSAFNAGDILDGSMEVDVSHAGGEFQHLMEEELLPKKKRVDRRARKHRILLRNQGFKTQLSDMTDAYLDWNEALGVSGQGVAVPVSDDEQPLTRYPIRVMDVFDATDSQIPLLHPAGVAAALILQGLMPSAPYTPRIAFTIRVLELYRTTHLRCPHLAIQAFVKGLCDMHFTPFRSNLANQFSIAYDQYLAIRDKVDARVQAALLRDSPNWRLKHACPACTYKLEGEDELVFDLLFTMDGNDSLKRILRRGPSSVDEEGEEVPGVSREMVDGRDVRGDYYLSRERVDRWARERLVEMLPEEASLGEEEEENPCAGRWKNMAHELTARMWGIFDETGVFLALCRHGFALVVADMVQSGELAKYPLAIVETLLEVFGKKLGGGYDIGCRFKTTLNESPLGARSRELSYTSLVGSFHGHAHNRLCQLSHLAKYVEGMGLEDLEGCERFFSKSNALAASTRYASVFHRKQKINLYLQHSDTMETYPALSTFLVNNYKQALDVVRGQAALEKQMLDRGVAAEGVFMQWLQEERTYLEGLSREPMEETMQMEYYQKLVNLAASRKQLDKASAAWTILTPENIATKDFTQSRETARRHALENMEKDLAVVQELEMKLGVSRRWTSNDHEWAVAAEMVAKRRYQRCLDHLESLVVSRMFELSKMNMSQTGYKLRKHIATALKARSQAIRTALEKYNTAAAALDPPRPPLHWDVVVEYAFLADFDLLADARQDVRQRPWSNPAARIVMDEYFKIQRAHKEIKRLNVEIPRFITHMRDEEAYLKARQDVVVATDPNIAHEIWLRRHRLAQVNALHRRRLFKLSRLQGFTGSLSPGLAKDSNMNMAGIGEEESGTLTLPNEFDSDEEGQDANEEHEVDDGEEEQEYAAMAHQILQATANM